MVFTVLCVLACLIAESFEQTDEPIDDKKSSTQMPVKLVLGSPGRGGHVVPNPKDFG